jgi:hypothetical protein
MASTQLEVLALWTRARHEADAATRRTYLSEAEQLTVAETDPREQQFARRVLQHFQRWSAGQLGARVATEGLPSGTAPRPSARLPRRGLRYRLAPADWQQR